MTQLRASPRFAESIGIGSDRWNISNSTIFTNIATWDLTLKVGSAAIDKGVDLTGEGVEYTKDITGKTRTGSWDIGAYEK
jgi:hypothetical protein